jgi:hypothetical protein
MSQVPNAQNMIEAPASSPRMPVTTGAPVMCAICPRGHGDRGGAHGHPVRLGEILQLQLVEHQSGGNEGPGSREKHPD